jgi:hypothetical protein
MLRVTLGNAKQVVERFVYILLRYEGEKLVVMVQFGSLETEGTEDRLETGKYLMREVQICRD